MVSRIIFHIGNKGERCGMLCNKTGTLETHRFNGRLPAAAVYIPVINENYTQITIVIMKTNTHMHYIQTSRACKHLHLISYLRECPQGFDAHNIKVVVYI